MKGGQGFPGIWPRAAGRGSHGATRGAARPDFRGVRQGKDGTAHSTSVGLQDDKCVPTVASKESLNVCGNTEGKKKKKAGRAPTAPSPLRFKALRLHPAGQGQHEGPGSS